MLKPLFTLCLLAVSSSAFAKSVDWTPYLKGMQDECNTQVSKAKILGATKTEEEDFRYQYDYTNVSKSTMPQNLQSSVSKFNKKNQDGDISVDMHLKNATFLGQPITRVSIGFHSGGYGEYLKVYFANSSFTQLKPKFTVNINGKKQAIGSTKSWVTTYDEQKGKYNPYKNVTKAQYNKIMKNNDSDGVYFLSTNANGWKGIGYEEKYELIFNNKNKLIECSSFVV